MKKQFTIFLILIFILGLIPLNFSDAITQNQTDALVQIVCPDEYGNWYSGSGTIIDSKGIILTNKHVVTDQYGGVINICAIGFIESISQEPNFYTNNEVNVAEVKYYTTTNDMDAAILYLENPTNKTYPYINIWDSNSDTLQFGDKIEVIGFPYIGGSTITYMSGDFSGFGGEYNKTQNYIKATVPLEYGNSGGSAYNSKGQFMGIPTMVVAGKLNSLSYILSINSIKEWMLNVLGYTYQQNIIEQEPVIEIPITSIQDDITPPDISKVKVEFYDCGQFYTERNEYGELISNKFPLYPDECILIPDTETKDYDISVEVVHVKVYIPDEVLADVDNWDSETSQNPNDYTLLAKIDMSSWDEQVKNYYLDRLRTPDPQFNYLSNNIGGFFILGHGKREGVYYYMMQLYDKAGNASEIRSWRYGYSKSSDENSDNSQDDEIDLNLVSRLKGYILLQVESYGEAYYIYPDDSKKYYLGRPADAFNVMRKLGLGATHDFITSHTIYPDNVLGKILLDVEQNGEAYYIYPKDREAYYLGRPADAFRIMRELGLGITNNDLSKIPEGSL